jgi:hypothetical protein
LNREEKWEGTRGQGNGKSETPAGKCGQRSESNTRAREEKGRKGENTLETRRDALLDWEESDLKYTPCTYKP